MPPKDNIKRGRIKEVTRAATADELRGDQPYEGCTARAADRRSISSENDPTHPIPQPPPYIRSPFHPSPACKTSRRDRPRWVQLFDPLRAWSEYDRRQTDRGPMLEGAPIEGGTADRLVRSSEAAAT